MRVRLREDALPRATSAFLEMASSATLSSFFFDFTFYRNAGHDLPD